MCPDDHVDSPLSRSFYSTLLFLIRPEPRQHIYGEREILEAVLQCMVMLVRQNGRGHEHCDLFTFSHSFEYSSCGDLCLSISDVTAQEPVHCDRLLHIALYFSYAPELVVSRFEREGLFEFLLPDRVGPEHESLRGLPSGRDF